MRLHDFLDEPITLGLMLTRACNYKCAHCCFSSGPDIPPVWVNDDLLRRYIHMAAFINECGGNAELNIIGGEPTLDLDEFDRVLAYLSQFDFPIHINTNGWWLFDESARQKFMEIVAAYIHAYGIDDGFTVRISYDSYHAEFSQVSYKQMTYLLELAFDEYGDTLCNDCRATFPDVYYECPECESDDVSITERKIPPRGDWIWVEDSSKLNVIASGRAIHAVDESLQNTHHFCEDTSLTFDPAGKLVDICCGGGNIRLGTIDDNPFVLLMAAREYVTTVKPECRTCQRTYKNWRSGNQAALLARAEEAWQKQKSHSWQPMENL